LLLWLGMSVHAQLGRYRTDFHTTPTNFADTIGIEWSHGQVYVPLTIQENRYRFLLDTGASQAVVFSDSPLAQGPLKGSIISHDATGRTDTVDMVLLPPIWLGHTKLTGLHANVQKRHPGNQQIDGILGFDLVNGGLSMKIDVPQQQLVITDRRSHFPITKADITCRYRLNYHVPYIDIFPFGKWKERVLFDTGSRQFFAMNKSHFDDAIMREFDRPVHKQPRDITVEGRSMGRHAMGHYGVEPLGEVAFMQLDSLRLGGSTFCRLHTLTTQGRSHLGAMLLRYGSVTFLPHRRRMIFQPATDLPIIPIDNRQLEIAFVADSQGRPQVGLVWERGAAYAAGLRQGDVIERIDHQPVSTLAQLAGWYFIRGREYIFTIRTPEDRQREIRWVRLPLREMSNNNQNPVATEK